MNKLHLQRCRNHGDREAAARCPGCGRFFCRECVAEHDRRFLCVTCLAAVSEPKRVKRRDWTWVGVPVQWVAGMLVAWLCFYVLGRVLADLPDAFHEGTFWKEVVGGPGKEGA